jgi:hypothetical protein
LRAPHKGFSFAVRLALVFLLACAFARAQGGPPLLTDDPGTPGNRQWEINAAATTSLQDDVRDFELPNVDINYGWGEHIQLNFQFPWLLHSATPGTQTGLGNGTVGAKLRFLDEEKYGCDLSTYPKFSWRNPSPTGLVDPGVQVQLPLEISKTFGRLQLNGEAGYVVKQYVTDELILGLAAGYRPNERLELLAELHSNPLRTFAQNESVFQLGFRKTLTEHYVLLFAAGRGLPGSTDGPAFIGYLGVQFLFGPHKAAK